MLGSKGATWGTVQSTLGAGKPGKAAPAVGTSVSPYSTSLKLCCSRAMCTAHGESACVTGKDTKGFVLLGSSASRINLLDAGMIL